ncbi:MAG: hypothetical protein NTW15_00305 [Burkholderiales bacterium]|nr:hypothetical protein [Burkholderiales bacterium]
MATYTIGAMPRLLAQAPTEAAPDPTVLLAPRRVDTTSKAPPTRQERRNVAEVLLRIAREQGTVGAPAVSERDILRVVKLDRALQQAKNANAWKAGPGELGKLGPWIISFLMNKHAVGLKENLVRAVTRFEVAAKRAPALARYALAHPTLLSNGIPANASEVEILKAIGEYRAATEELERVRGEIESAILRLSPQP